MTCRNEGAPLGCINGSVLYEQMVTTERDIIIVVEIDERKAKAKTILFEEFKKFKFVEGH